MSSPRDLEQKPNLTTPGGSNATRRGRLKQGSQRHPEGRWVGSCELSNILFINDLHCLSGPARATKPSCQASAVQRPSDRPVVIDLPALVIAQRVGDGAAVMAAVDGYMMLITVLANVLEQRLQAAIFTTP